MTSVLLNGVPLDEYMKESMPKRVLKLVERDGFFGCYWCGTEFDPWAAAIRNPVVTVDHVMPRKRGGGNQLSNLVLACRPCNQSKADDHPLVWLARLVSCPSRPPAKMKTLARNAARARVVS